MAVEIISRLHAVTEQKDRQITEMR